MKTQDIEQQQLIGYWAKTQGFSLRSLEKADIKTLQALRMATNCLKARQFLEPHEKQTFHNLINTFRSGKQINTALLNSVFKKARKLQRKEASQARKATR